MLSLTDVLLCRYSHGELVSVDDLQPFLEPDYRYAHLSNMITGKLTCLTC